MTQSHLLFIANTIANMPTHAANLRAQQSSVAHAFVESLKNTTIFDFMVAGHPMPFDSTTFLNNCNLSKS